MPSNYSGNPGSQQAPGDVPGPDSNMILALPNDGELHNVSSILQPFKELADWFVWLKNLVTPVVGVRRWSSGTTYAAGDLTVYGTNSLTYQALSSNTNWQPDISPDVWARWGHDDNTIQDVAVKVYEDLTGITCTFGASVTDAFRFSYNRDGYRRLEMMVHSVPANNYTTVNLNGAANVKFRSYCRTGQVSILAGSNAYGGEMGLSLNLQGDPNLFAVWWKKGAGDGSTLSYAGVTLLGA